MRKAVTCRQKAKWSEGFQLSDYKEHSKSNGKVLEEMAGLTSEYDKWIQAEMKKSKKEIVVSTVGKINPALRLTQHIEDTMTSNIVQCLGTMLDSLTF
jgi:26S proteasome regulatory subunit N11